jgi:hypothetical protein
MAGRFGAPFLFVAPARMSDGCLTSDGTHFQRAGSNPSKRMRRCDHTQLAFRPFSADDLVVVVGEDGEPREVALGGAGLVERRPTLTLYLPTVWEGANGQTLTVNVLPGARRLRLVDAAAAAAPFRYQASESVVAPRIADAKLAFECRVIAIGALSGLEDHPQMLVAEVLAAYQRWPRGCAI